MPQAQTSTLQAAQQAAQAQVAALQQQQQGQQGQPGGQHVDGRFGMLLCRVVLGRIAQGTQGLRRPPTGADSVTQLVRCESWDSALLPGQLHPAIGLNDIGLANPGVRTVIVRSNGPPAIAWAPREAVHRVAVRTDDSATARDAGVGPLGCLQPFGMPRQGE